MADNDSTKNITAKDVATFLADNPDSIADMLATYPKLLALCLTVARDHAKDKKEIDSKVVDLSPALNFKARRDARKIKQTHESLLHVASENMLGWTRVHHATLGLLASTDLPGMCQVIANEFPVIFDLNQCQLIIEEEVAMQNVIDTGLGFHPATQIDAATKSRSLYLGLPNDAAKKLLLRPAQSLAIIGCLTGCLISLQLCWYSVEKPRIAFIPILAAICSCYLLKWSSALAPGWNCKTSAMITTSHQPAWLRWLASEKRYGQNTLDAYQRDLDDFSY